jgi:hypothetical protein
MSAALLIGLAACALVAWRLLRARPLAVLAAVAAAGWMGHYGVLPVPERVRAPVREAVGSAEAWRAERIAVVRCRAAVLAAFASGDEERAVRRLEAACGDRRERRRILSAQPEAADELFERDRSL